MKPSLNSKIAAIHPSGWNKPHLMDLLRKSAGRRVLVIGDVGVDRYVMGTVERISPEAPVPIVLVETEKLKLGLAANVADNVKTMGGVPMLVGVVGRDRGAQDFRDLLKGAGISSSYLCVDAGRRTVLKERVVSERQQLLRVDYESVHPVTKPVAGQLLARIRSCLSRVDGVILEDYAKGLFSGEMAKAIFSLARRQGKFVAVDPNHKTPAELYRGAFVLTPNTKEAELLSGVKIHDEASLIQAGKTLLKRAAAKHVVVTRGKDGMAIFSAASKTVRMIPTYAREVYDVSGAGDTVISVLTLVLAAGGTIEDAALLGNLAAGVEVGKRGTATVSPDEIRVAIEFFGTVV